ncbi:MAG: ExeM/NucH family extracellular endonuclease [Xanthomonadales bacterium]
MPETPACDASATPISDIQGNDWRSPLEEQPATVRGVVTALEPGRGFYLEQAGDRWNGTVSRALFVADDGRLAGVRPGHDLQLSGVVEEAGAERDTMTTLAAVRASAVCAENRELPLTTVELPLDNRSREALEGMRLRIDDDLVVTDTYSLYRGAVTLSAGAALRIPTEDARPGAQASELGRRNRQQALAAQFPGPDVPPLPAGTALGSLTGVMGHDGRRQRLLAEQSLAVDVRLPERLPPAPAGSLRVVNSNLLNFFNGDGRGGGFPTERGAETPAEFRAQQARTAAAFAEIKPDLLAVQELENDGFDRHSAAATLRDLLGDATGARYAVIEPATPRIGEDVITVGLFYRPDRLRPVGPAQVLTAAEFRGISRQPLAQVFETVADGERFLVVVNHLKSKGSCPDEGPDRAQGDGQGCWNPSRTAAVRAQLPWLQGLAADAATDRILIVGDMNAWRLEDPIRAFRAAGLIDVVEARQGLPLHSYRYFGQGGTLDYAFASPALAEHVRDARNWHINADWPRNMDLPQPWLRMSDHDPVIVDLDFRHSSSSD